MVEDQQYRTTVVSQMESQSIKQIKTHHHEKASFKSRGSYLTALTGQAAQGMGISTSSKTRCRWCEAEQAGARL